MIEINWSERKWTLTNSVDTREVFHEMSQTVFTATVAHLLTLQVNSPPELKSKPTLTDGHNTTLLTQKLQSHSKASTKKIVETEQWNNHGLTLLLIMNFSHSKPSEQSTCHGWDGGLCSCSLYPNCGFSLTEKWDFGNKKVWFAFNIRNQATWTIN